MNIKNIVKVFIYVFVFSLCFFMCKTAASAEDDAEKVWKLRKGAFIKVIPREEFSTLTADIEDEVTFINIQDMYVYETNAIPAGTVFYGEIEDVREPVQGRDGALKVSIYKMITPDKKVYNIKAHLYGENDNYIGGKITESIYYHKVPHYTQSFEPMLQAAPLNIYEQGRHTIVKAGEEMFIIIDEDIILK